MIVMDKYDQHCESMRYRVCGVCVSFALGLLVNHACWYRLVGQGGAQVYKRLYRSRRDAWLGGVAGGIAEYFDIDPVIVRLVWLFTGFFAGGGVLAYLVAWILIPLNPDEAADPRFESRRSWSETVETVVETTRRGPSNPRQTLGWILVIIGFFVLLAKLIPWMVAVSISLWPIAIIILGIALLIQGMRR